MSPNQLPPPTQDPNRFRDIPTREIENHRSEIETATAQSLTHVYEAYAGNVIPDPATGYDHLTLYMPFKDDVATLQLRSRKDEHGNRVANLSFSAPNAWTNQWQLIDGPGKAPKLEQGRIDPQTGEFKKFVRRNPTESDPDPLDSNSDFEIAFWGKLWPENLAVATPEKPKTSLFKALGKRMLRR